MLPIPDLRSPHEKNVTALPEASCAPVRIFGPDGHEERSRDHQSPPPGRPQTSGRCPDGAEVCQAYAGLGVSFARCATVDIQPGSSIPHRTECDGHPFSAHAAPHSETLPRARVIRRREVFEKTRNKGRRVSNRHMMLNFLSREAMGSGETGSVAFLTPKRVGAATVRNRLRRRMREIYRRELAPAKETAYLIWIARPPAVELSLEELRKCMAGLLARKQG